MIRFVTSATSPAKSLVLRAWAEHGQLRVQVSPIASDRVVPPVLVASTEEVLDLVRAWLAFDVLHPALDSDDTSS